MRTSKIVISITILSFNILFNAVSSRLLAQDDFPADYFRPPLDIPLYLSGTFGELRSDHFHSGIDIKTGGAEGKNVYAIADGYVSRIKVSAGGYGKAIYITHPNGFVSVYGHLKRYQGKIQAYIIEKQYQKESFSIEVFPAVNDLPVKKGEIIAVSGNTGSSSAPHLHFEIRDEATQQPVNPLFFKSIRVNDFTRPKINQIAIYPVDQQALINGQNDTVFFKVGGWGENHYLIDKPDITVSGKIAFGINTYDLMNEIPNKNGVYAINMYIDSTKLFGLKMDKLSFATARYINSLIDYGHYKQTKTRLVRTELDTNNLLRNYHVVQNNGIVVFNDSMLHNVRYEVSDAYENISALSFNITSAPNDMTLAIQTEVKQEGYYIDYTKKILLKKEGMMLSFPANAFYRSFYLNVSIDSTDAIFSPVYKVHNSNTPVHKAYEIKIKADSIPDGLQSKMFLAYHNGNGNALYGFIGANWDGNYLTAQSKAFGKYTILLDTVMPEISPINIGEGKDISSQQTISVKIWDEETGIHSFRGTLNGKWILMEYDPKKQLLTYHYDQRLQSGENLFTLIVEDMLGNQKMYSAKLYY